MKLSVNILCWNTLKTLKMTLDILREELSDIKHEVIIIDNGSDDGTKDFLCSLKWIYNGDIRLVFNPENMGISRGKNQGIFMSGGEYVLLLDGDVVPVPNSIKKMIEFLDKNQDKHTIGFYPNKFALQPNGYGTEQHESFCHELFDVKESNTTCLFYGMYRKTVFHTVRMDESGEYANPGYGWEDHDFFMQMKVAGIKQWVAHVNHAGGKYYHAINSSIRPNCLGYQKYMDTSKARGEQFHKKWAHIPKEVLNAR